MLYKLQSIQIPKYWEIIKFSAVNADGVLEPDIPKYTSDLLLGLLNDKYMCIISLNDKKEIQRIILASFIHNTILKKKFLLIKTAYGFAKGTAKDWEDIVTQLRNFSKKEACDSIVMTTANSAVVEIAEMNGFVAHSKNYALTL